MLVQEIGVIDLERCTPVYRGHLRDEKEGINDMERLRIG